MPVQLDFQKTQLSTERHRSTCIQRGIHDTCRKKEIHFLLSSVEISCPEVEAPEYGMMLECGSKLGEHCDFDCVEGYIMEKGSSRRTCQESGEWSGKPPVCAGKLH